MHLRIKVKPRSSKDEITGTMDDGTLKVSLKAAPENGKANEALIKLLSKEYNTDKIKIISGHTSQIKLIRIDE